MWILRLGCDLFLRLFLSLLLVTKWLNRNFYTLFLFLIGCKCKSYFCTLFQTLLIGIDFLFSEVFPKISNSIAFVVFMGHWLASTQFFTSKHPICPLTLSLSKYCYVSTPKIMVSGYNFQFPIFLQRNFQLVLVWIYISRHPLRMIHEDLNNSYFFLCGRKFRTILRFRRSLQTFLPLKFLKAECLILKILFFSNQKIDP